MYLFLIIFAFQKEKKEKSKKQKLKKPKSHLEEEELSDTELEPPKAKKIKKKKEEFDDIESIIAEHKISPSMNNGVAHSKNQSNSGEESSTECDSDQDPVRW